VQCLNQLRHRVPPIRVCTALKACFCRWLL
jgi:hypothetical protein